MYNMDLEIFSFRLDAYDRNYNFGGGERVEREYCMEVPSYEKYKDINKDTVITRIKEEAVCAYLGKMNREIDANVRYLYESKFLKYARLACEDGLFFVKAECKAQMKKTMSYAVDASFDVDGCVVECQCECAVGMGPVAACKHVCVILYALQKFCENGDLTTEETCTQNLQTFHQTKPYKGSPIKAKDLPLANNADVIYDPRPLQFRNMSGYHDTFRNVWLNHPSVNTLPISHLFSIANTTAMDSDHDYFQEKLSEMWLKNSNITNITSMEIEKFENQTRGQSINPLWQSERCKRIHSSNFGKICKCTEKTNMHNLANRLTKYTPQINVAPIIHGRCYESVAIKSFEEKCKVKTQKCGTFVSKSHPFLAASPDAVIDETSILEVKCPFTAKHEHISNETVPFLKNVNASLELDMSHDYFYQIQGQLFCTNRTECTLVVYTFKDLKVIPVPRDEEFIENMIHKLESFFEKYFRSAVLNKFYHHI